MSTNLTPALQRLLDEQDAGVLAPFGRLAMQPWFRWSALAACLLAHVMA